VQTIYNFQIQVKPSWAVFENIKQENILKHNLEVIILHIEFLIWIMDHFTNVLYEVIVITH
jgi:hypothetical protein